MKHKHAEAIIAWANGAEIEFRFNSECQWHEVKNPQWETHNEYRVVTKEKKKVTKWLWVRPDGVITSRFYPEAHNTYSIKIEWSATEFEVEE